MASDSDKILNTLPLTLKPLIKRTPAKLPSSDEMLKSLAVADGFEINLFASESNFELCNRKIAFDSKEGLGSHNAIIPWNDTWGHST